ncbi:S8 family serine peptidase [Limibacter armeniacum]|uniref:S8 family serine peptidase n=1 Tax=Limibacter armeniacum TaxID=466084 RepID=UPI002FE6A845
MRTRYTIILCLLLLYIQKPAISQVSTFYIKLQSDCQLPTPYASFAAVLAERLSPEYCAHLFAHNASASLPLDNYWKLQQMQSYGIDNLYEVSINNKSLAEVQKLLSNIDCIAYIEEVPTNLPLATIPSDSLQDKEVNVLCRLYDAWDISQGSSQTIIGIVDTGVDLSHPDLINKYYYNVSEMLGQDGVDDDQNGFVDDSVGYDFGDGDNYPQVTNHDHGTGVAGCAAAQTNNLTGISGTGYNCRFMPVKIYNTESGALINTMEAVIYAATNGCQIVNLSWGRKGGYSATEQAIFNYLTESHDVLFVAAAGNDPSKEEDWYPASYENVISVTGVDNNLSHTSFKYSPYIDVAAIGYGIRILVQGNKYSISTGSSYASPIVSGIAGLVRSHFPDLSAKQVAHLLRNTANPVIYQQSSEEKKGKIGKGLIDAFAALTQVDDVMGVSGENLDFYTANRRRAIQDQDTISISFDFTNYLSASSEDLKVTLSTEDSAFTVLSSTFHIGKLEKLAKISNAALPFLVKLHLQNGQQLASRYRFKLTFEDATNNFFDEQYFLLRPGNRAEVYYLNQLAGIFDADGTIGTQKGIYLQPQGRTGISYLATSQMSLVFAQSAQKVSDRIDASDADRNSDFVTVSPITVSINDSIRSLTMTYSDRSSSNSNASNLLIKQTVHAPQNDAVSQSFIVDLEITNQSDSVIDTLYTGLLTEWAQSGKIKWDQDHQYAVFTQADAQLFAGIKILNGFPEGVPPSFHAFSKTLPSSIVNLNDGLSDQEKFNMLASGISTTSFSGNSEDQVFQNIGTLITQLSPDESRHIGILITISDNSEAEMVPQLMRVDQMAQQILKAPKPYIPPIQACNNLDVMLAPEGESPFAFYEEGEETKLLHVGETYQLKYDSSKQYFVASIGQVFPSDTVHIQEDTSVFNPKINISARGLMWSFSHNLQDLQSWEWDFGDGIVIKDVKNPIHKYFQNGEYNIKFTYTTSLGCQFVILKQILTGKTSSWTDLGWLNGVVPDSLTDVHIMSDKPVPSFSSSSIYLKDSFQLNIPEGVTINVKGNFVNHSTAQIAVKGKGVLHFSDAFPQHILEKATFDCKVVIGSESLVNTRDNLFFTETGELLHQQTANLQGTVTFQIRKNPNLLSLPVKPTTQLNDRVTAFNEATKSWEFTSLDLLRTQHPGFYFDSESTFQVSGTPLTDSLTTPITYTNQGGQGINLIGNPYPATISAYQLLQHPQNTHLNGCLWLYDENQHDSPPNCFRSISLLDLYTDGDQLISPGQAFFVKASTDRVVTFQNELKTHPSKLHFPEDLKTVKLVLSEGQIQRSDALIGFSNTFSLGRDFGIDTEALLLKDTPWSLYIINDAVFKSRSGVPFPKTKTSFTFQSKAPKGKVCALQLLQSDWLFNDWLIVLEDIERQEEMVLSAHQHYTFQQNADIHTFRLNFIPKVVNEISIKKQTQLKVSGSSALTLLEFPSEFRDCTLHIYDLQGKKILDGLPVTSNNQPIRLTLPLKPFQCYLFQLISEQQVSTLKVVFAQ